MNKKEVSSPTVALKSVILAVVIEGHEDREVVIVDTLNEFIKTYNPKEVGYQRDIIKIRGKLAHILVDIAPEVYGPYITYKNGKVVLYLE